MTQPTSSSPHVEELRDSLASLLQESQALRTDVAAAERARRTTERARRRGNLISTATLALLVVLTTLLAVIGYQNNRASQRIADCTTAGGRCYEEGRARTGGAITDLIRAQVYVAECARLQPGESGPVFDRALEGCVAAKLAGQARRATPTPTPAWSPSR